MSSLMDLGEYTSDCSVSLMVALGPSKDIESSTHNRCLGFMATVHFFTPFIVTLFGQLHFDIPYRRLPSYSWFLSFTSFLPNPLSRISGCLSFSEFSILSDSTFCTSSCSSYLDSLNCRSHSVSFVFPYPWQHHLTH